MSRFLLMDVRKPVSFLVASICLSVLFPEHVAAYGLRCDFSQDHRTYQWNFKFDYAGDSTQTLHWGLSSSINSILTKRSDGPDWSQEDGSINLKADYRLTRKLKTGTFFSQSIYSSEGTKATTSDCGISSELNLAGIRFVQVLGARSIDNKDSAPVGISRSERGFNYSQTISASPRLFSASTADIAISQSTIRMKNVPVQKRDLYVSFSKYLTDSPTLTSERDSLQVGYREAWGRKKFFSGRSQKTNHRDVNLRASKRIPLGLKLDLVTDYLYDRDRRFSADWDTLDFYLLSSSLNAHLRVERRLFERILAAAFYRYMRSEWDYLDETRDQEMEGGELGGEVKAEITRADSLYLVASTGVTSFYAPFSGQFNDRDRLTVLAWGEYLHVFSPWLRVRVEGGFRNFHQLYMSGLSSFDNNHDQTYVLSPTLTWLPSQKLTLKQNYRIKANYRYYDYEKSEESSRNSLYRRASSTSEATFRYNKRMVFFFGYTYKYEDDGPLIWTDQWVQKISRDQRTNTINLSLDYRPFEKVSISPGYTHEKRKSWDHEAEDAGGLDKKAVKEKRVLADTFYRNVISLSFRYSVDLENYLHLSAAHRLQDGRLTKRESCDYVTVSIARVF